MLRRKRFFYIFTACTVLLFFLIAVFNSCRLINDALSESLDNKNPSIKNSIVIKARVSNTPSHSSSIRSALPSDFIDADGKTLVFAGTLSKNEGGGIFVAGHYENGFVSFEFPSPLFGEGDHTLEVRVYANGTREEQFSTEKPLLSGKASVSLSADSSFVDAPKITLKPTDSSKQGAVKLAVLIPSDYVLCVDDAGFSIKQENGSTISIEGKNYKKYSISAKIEKGAYTVAFKLLSDVKNPDSVVYVWTETINVYPGMTTDKWDSNAGAIHDGARITDVSHIYSTFYVKGQVASGKKSVLENFKGGDTTEENGSLSYPYTTIQKAIDRVIAINDGKTDFTIWVEGTVTLDEKADGMVNIPILSNKLSIAIKALSQTAELNADKKGSVIHARTGTGGHSLHLTLENINITGALSNHGGVNVNAGSKGTFTMNGGEIYKNEAKEFGGGVYVLNGTFTLNNVKISGNKAATGGGVYVSKGAFTMNNVKISGNTATKGSGVYVNKGIFSVSGSTCVSHNNDVYLSDDCAITIAGNLTASNALVATITLPTPYAEGTKVLAGATDLLSAHYKKFALSDSNYEIGQDGNVVNKSTSEVLDLAGAKDALNKAEDGDTVSIAVKIDTSDGNGYRNWTDFVDSINSSKATTIELTIPDGSEMSGYLFNTVKDKTLSIRIGGKSIPSGAFSDCAALESLVILPDVEEIGIQAFSGCKNLKKLTILKSVKVIHERGFVNCTSLTDVNIPSSVNIIENQAFSGCEKLETVTLSEGLETIGQAAFSGTNLHTVTIPASVKTIESRAFSTSQPLSNVKFEETSGWKIGDKTVDEDLTDTTLNATKLSTDDGGTTGFAGSTWTRTESP